MKIYVLQDRQHHESYPCGVVAVTKTIQKAKRIAESRNHKDYLKQLTWSRNLFGRWELHSKDSHQTFFKITPWDV